MVEIYNLHKLINAVEKPTALKDGTKKDLNAFFSFNGHQSEGFAMDWSPQTPGKLCVVHVLVQLCIDQMKPSHE